MLGHFFLEAFWGIIWLTCLLCDTVSVDKTLIRPVCCRLMVASLVWCGQYVCRLPLQSISNMSSETHILYDLLMTYLKTKRTLTHCVNHLSDLRKTYKNSNDLTWLFENKQASSTVSRNSAIGVLSLLMLLFIIVNTVVVIIILSYMFLSHGLTKYIAVVVVSSLFVAALGIVVVIVVYLVVILLYICVHLFRVGVEMGQRCLTLILTRWPCFMRTTSSRPPPLSRKSDSCWTRYVCT